MSFRRISHVLAIALLCAPLCAFGVSQASAETIRLTSGGAPKETPFGRYLDKLLTEAFGRLGYEFELHNVEAKRASHLVNLGYFDGEAMRVQEYGEKFPLMVRVNVSHSDLVFSAYAVDAELNISSWQDLNREQFVIAYRRGAVRAQNMVRLHLSNRKLLWAYSPYSGLKMVLDKSANIYVGVQMSVEAVLDQYPKLKSKIVKAGEVDRLPGYIYLNEKHADLAKKLEVVLLDMKAKGLMTKYYQDIYEASKRP